MLSRSIRIYEHVVEQNEEIVLCAAKNVGALVVHLMKRARLLIGVEVEKTKVILSHRQQNLRRKKKIESTLLNTIQRNSLYSSRSRLQCKQVVYKTDI